MVSHILAPSQSSKPPDSEATLTILEVYCVPRLSLHVYRPVDAIVHSLQLVTFLHHLSHDCAVNSRRVALAREVYRRPHSSRHEFEAFIAMQVAEVERIVKEVASLVFRAILSRPAAGNSDKC